MTETAISPLRRRRIEDMTVRNFLKKTQNDYIRHVQNLTAFLRRSPDTAMAEDLRLYQLHLTEAGVRPPSINSAVSYQSALRIIYWSDSALICRKALECVSLRAGWYQPCGSSS